MGSARTGNAASARTGALRLGAAVALLLAGCDATINRSIEIGDGEIVVHGLTSVNGGIRVGDDATVDGAATTVNGSIRVGDDSSIGGLTTVNGSIRVGRNVEIDGEVDSVNGSFSADEGTRVLGSVETVNGSIDLEGAEVRGDVTTRNGDVTLRSAGRITGDLVVAKLTGSARGTLDIELLEGSVVEGDVRVEGDRRVTVTIGEGSAVRGSIEGAEVEERPAPDRPEVVEAAEG